MADIKSDQRDRAEKKVSDLTENSDTLSPEEARRTLHELRVHQEELETQNEELRRTQAELAAAKARYFDLYNQAPAGYFTLSKEGLILEVNLTAAAQLGFEQAALVDEPITRFILKEDQDVYYLRKKEFFETGAPQACELRLVKKDGTPVWMLLEAAAIRDAAGAPVCRVVLSEITERKRAEEALRESEARYRTLYESSRDAIMTLFPPDWGFAAGNPAAVGMFGAKDEADFVSRSPWEVSPEFQPDGELSSVKAKRMIETAMEQGSNFFNWTHKKIGGPDFPATVLLSRIELGGKAGLQATVRDISAQKRAEAEQKKLGEQLLHSQKLEAVGLLAGGVAHDFNNILTAIKCYAGFIQKGLPPQDPKLDDVQEILNSVGRAIILTRQLLAFSRRQIMAPDVVDINSVVGNITNMLRRIIGENIVLNTKLFPAPCLVLVDPGQVEQVIMNLAVNARDAMYGGGTITLETEIVRPPQEFFAARPELAAGPLVCVRVRDTGCGMTAEVKSRIFEPFFTTKAQGRGTGLGLSMVFGIVKQSRGEIEVESEPGKGSTFLIYLPFSEIPLRQKAERKDKYKDINKGEDAPGKGRETVLFVEDEETLRRLGERVLRAGGYTALVAADGPAALKLMEERGKPVDILISDVVLPGMSGRELASELARRKLIGRTLYMSGYTDDAIVKHGVLEPGIAFIYKPFTVDAVLLKLREVLDGPAGQAKA